MSILAIVVMLTLFLAETIAFAVTNFKTDISLDDNTDPHITINFNITFHALECDYLSVDATDSLGTNRQNITKNVEKWHLDNEGQRRIFAGRNREQRQVQHEEHDDEVMEAIFDEDENGVASLKADNFKEYLNQHEM